ncbi:hypothetical protein [Halomarina pelagica]|nr:hypothetical protein [Halomarina sp. BND7]
MDIAIAGRGTIAEAYADGALSDPEFAGGRASKACSGRSGIDGQ